MIPGPYAICLVDFPADSDGANYRTLAYGYETAADAAAATPAVAANAGVSADDCAVIRFISPEEVERFTD